MNRYRWVTGLVMIASLFTGCGKEDGVCISNTGRIVRQDRVALPFHHIEIYDNINVFLTQDTSLSAITVETGSNLIAGITTEIDSGRLVLRNRNSCNWLRSFEVPVNVYLTFTKLDTILFQAAGNITCLNEWANDSIYLNVIEGAGRIDLALNVFKSVIHVRYGTVRLDARGYSQVTFISSQGYGPLQMENLHSKFTYIYTFSPNDIYVNAEVGLGVEIGNIGNVYYHGDPVHITENIYGSGQLIKY